MGRFRLAAISALALGLAATSVATFVATSPALASSNVTVRLKASEAKGAPVVKSVRLYGSSHALVIGIDNYTNGWPRLTNAVKDARLVAKALREKGFEVTLRTNLKAAEMERAFKEFYIIKGEKADARLFLWFAGHGYTEGGEGYLVPADAPKPQSKARFRLKALSLRRVGDFVRLADSKHAFAVFDSCFSGTVFDSARSMPPVAITKATTLPVRQFLSSGDAGQTVSDNGTFRELFLRALRGEERADANGDGYVTASEIGLFMTDRMTNLTASRQTPRYGKLRDKDFDRGDFVFRLGTRTGNGVDPETVFWKLVRQDGDPDGLKAYLQQYPGGKFAAAARVSLELREERRLRQEQAKQRKETARLAALEQERKRREAEREATRMAEAEARRRAEEEEIRRIAALEAERNAREGDSARQQLAAVSPSRVVEPPAVEATPFTPSQPAEFQPLPVGTVATYDSWGFTVMESNGFESIIKTRSHNYRVFHGVVGITGEGLFSIYLDGNIQYGSNHAPYLGLSAESKGLIDKIWPLEVGKSVSFVLEERLFDALYSFSEEDDWRIESKVVGTEHLNVAGRSLATYVIRSEAKSALGRAFKQTQWYHPNSGLVVKLVREWGGKKHVQSKIDTYPGAVQSYELAAVLFPDGDTRGLDPFVEQGRALAAKAKAAKPDPEQDIEAGN